MVIVTQLQDERLISPFLKESDTLYGLNLSGSMIVFDQSIRAGILSGAVQASPIYAPILLA